MMRVRKRKRQNESPSELNIEISLLYALEPSVLHLLKAYIIGNLSSIDSGILKNKIGNRWDSDR